MQQDGLGGTARAYMSMLLNLAAFKAKGLRVDPVYIKLLELSLALFVLL